MSEKPLRGRIPVNRRMKPPRLSSSLRRRPLVKPSKFIKRCNSEPALLMTPHDVSINATEDHAGVIEQRRSCAEVFWSSPELPLPNSPPKILGYNKDSKVVVNVTVEGSPGPVRAMVKLGSSVEETMEIVRKKYNSERRSPQLDQHSISTFELHPSYFSLQCFDKSNMIGDIGCRSFYMRKCNYDNSLAGSEISARENNSPPSNPIVLIPNSIFRSFNKIKRFSIRLLKILGCMGS